MGTKCIGKRTYSPQSRRVLRRWSNSSLKVYRMSPLHLIPTWLSALLMAVTLLLTVRLITAVNTDLDIGVALRTYVFWALVCAPVAYLADVVVRTVVEYRVVRVVVARVRSRR
jgi:hypothetical protein